MSESQNVGIECVLCGSPTKKWFDTSNRGVGPDGIFEIFRCVKCRSTVINPVPTDLGQYYSGYHAIPSGKRWKRAIESCQHRLEVVRRIGKPNAALLDVGAGSGAFVAAALELGYPTQAIEQDAACRRHIESISPYLVCDDISTFSKSYVTPPEIITLWHVFEHIPDPSGFLAQIRESFPPTTKIIIEVPSADSWIFKIMRAVWPHLDAPRHVFLPTNQGMREVARRNGMKVEQVVNRDKGAWGAFSISHFGNRTGEGRGVQVLRRLIQICLTPLFQLEPLSHSSTSTYVLTQDA